MKPPIRRPKRQKPDMKIAEARKKILWYYRELWLAWVGSQDEAHKFGLGLRMSATVDISKLLNIPPEEFDKIRR